MTIYKQIFHERKLMNNLFKYLFYLLLASVAYTFFNDIHDGKMPIDSTLEDAEINIITKTEKALQRPKKNI